jgi:hypothetical protein
MLALSVIAGAAVQPSPRSPHRGAPACGTAAPFVPVGAQRLDPRLGYATDVLRAIDGVHSAVRVRVLLGLDVDTHVRLRDIDAAELHARCVRRSPPARRTGDPRRRQRHDLACRPRQICRPRRRHSRDTRNARRSAAILAGGFARRYNGGRPRELVQMTGNQNRDQDFFA